MMKRIPLMLMFCLLLTGAVLAQEKPASDATKPAAKPATAAALPTVDEVLEKFVKALGGKEALEKQTSETIKGALELEGMGMSGAFESAAKAPNKRAVLISLSGFGNIHQVFDGTKAWSADPMAGLRELSGAELAQMKRGSDLLSPLNYRKNFTKLELKGIQKVESAEAYVIEATPAEGSAEKHFFDVTTGLLIRVDGENESPQGKVPMETYLSDYKEVEGVKAAHTIRQVTPQFTAVIKISEIKRNPPVEDTRFNKPSGQ